jgi:hypothetical protein
MLGEQGRQYFEKRFAEHGPQALHRLQERQLESDRANRPPLVYQQSIEYLRGTNNNLETAEGKLQDLKKTYDETRASGRMGLIPVEEVKKATEEYVKQKRIVDALKQAETDRKNIAEALRHAQESVRERLQSPFELPAQAELRKHLEMRGVPGTPAAGRFRQIYQPLINFETTERQNKLDRQMLETQQTIEREMGRARQGGVIPVNIRQLGQDGVTRADVERDINEQQQQRMRIAMETFQEEYKLIKAREIDARDTVSLAQQHRDIVATTGKLATGQIEAEMAKKKEMHVLDEKERDLARQHVETMSKIQLADQEESIKHDADLARKRAELRFKGDNPAAGIVESYRIAVTESQQLYDLEMQRIALHETGYKAEEDAAIALHKLHREDEAAREEAQFKLAQMQQQQLDTLKGKIEPLYHTLFTNPRQFGSQLRQTVQEAALHPIVSGLSEMTATALHPLIYGAGGTGGIAGALGEMFGGGRHLNDLTLLPDKSVPVTIVNDHRGGGIGTTLYSAGGFSGGGTVGGGYSPMGGGYSPMGGGLPFSVPTMSFGPGVGGYSPMGGTFGGFGPGGTPGFAPGPIGLPDFGGANAGTAAAMGGGFGVPGFGGTATGGRDFNLGSMTGLVRNLATGWKQMLGLSKPAVFGETPGAESMARAAAGQGIGGALKGLAGSPLAKAGAMTGGMMLAQAGLLGESRGTVGGVFEGMFGGAGVGFAMGGPLGAAIGAAAGLGIGLGEMIAGVESPRNEAKRLVHSVYHISINNTTADQIVAIANQSYGSRVSIAVRSPEVRHMLGLYAAGTGQGSVFAQSANEAHGASLVESGGRLQQQATYQYGQAYSQSSSLPVYGGVPTQTLGAPGGGMQLSLNIGGQDAAKFMTGQVVTPDVVQTQYAQAMYGSAGRVPQALMMAEPGSIAS